MSKVKKSISYIQCRSYLFNFVVLRYFKIGVNNNNNYPIMFIILFVTDCDNLRRSRDWIGWWYSLLIDPNCSVLNSINRALERL